VGAELLARAGLQVRIAQPGGEESLNVASAAAMNQSRRCAPCWLLPRSKSNLRRMLSARLRASAAGVATAMGGA
jgi:hypothetical protein